MPLIAVVLVVLGLFGIGWFPLYLLQIAESAPRVPIATTLCTVVMARVLSRSGSSWITSATG